MPGGSHDGRRPPRGSTEASRCDQPSWMEVPALDHDCSLMPLLKELLERVEKLEHENGQLKKQMYGRRSERTKLPRPIVAESATPEQILATRRDRAKTRLEAPVMTIEHRVPDAERRCTSCGGTDLSPLGTGKRTSVWE